MSEDRTWVRPKSSARNYSVVMLPYCSVSQYDTYSLIEDWLVETFGKSGKLLRRRWFCEFVEDKLYYDREMGRYFIIKDHDLRHYLIGDREPLISVFSSRVELYFKHPEDEMLFRLKWEGVMDEVLECQRMPS